MGEIINFFEKRVQKDMTVKELLQMSGIRSADESFMAEEVEELRQLLKNEYLIKSF